MQRNCWIPRDKHTFRSLVDQYATHSKLKEVDEWALQGYEHGGKGSLDEEQVFIRDGELFG